MWATSDGPRIEDFGITEDDLARAPRLFLSSHRGGVLLAIYILAAALVFFLIIKTSHSIPAAAFFTIITLAAGSVLLLPILVLLVCAGEQAEERWLCRRVPIMRACLAYQRALAQHRRLTDEKVGRPLDAKDWPALSESTFKRQLRAELDRQFDAAVSEVDREQTGFDFLVDLAGKRAVVRYEAGSAPLAAAVGRELAAALDDSHADVAVIVTAAEPTRALDDYIVNRPIRIAAPWALSAIEIPDS
jgi:hypothetical protein